LKLLTYWYILWSLPVAAFLASFPRLLAPAVMILLLLLTGAGLADTLSVTASERNGGIELTSRDGVAFASLVAHYTASTPQALILAAPEHNHPISLLSGRRIFLGYEGWLWTYGINAAQRKQELIEMYAATDRGLSLLHERNIRYISLGPQERSVLHANEAKLLSLFPIAVEHTDYKLLEIPLN
jgi:hypothetical protein